MEKVYTCDLGKAAYNRRKEIEVGYCYCDSCHVNKITIQTDSSSGEYGGISLCIECINDLFDKYKYKNMNSHVETTKKIDEQCENTQNK